MEWMIVDWTFNNARKKSFLCFSKSEFMSPQLRHFTWKIVTQDNVKTSHMWLSKWHLLPSRKRRDTPWGKVICLEMCVCPQEGCLLPGGACSWGGTPPGGCLLIGGCLVPGGAWSWGGVTVPRGLVRGGLPGGDPPDGYCILLECIHC